MEDGNLVGPNELYSVEYAAKRLGSDRGGPTELTVRDWIKKGRLAVTRAGRRVMVAESQIQDFLRESKAVNERRKAQGARRG